MLLIFLRQAFHSLRMSKFEMESSESFQRWKSHFAKVLFLTLVFCWQLAFCFIHSSVLLHFKIKLNKKKEKSDVKLKKCGKWKWKSNFSFFEDRKLCRISISYYDLCWHHQRNSRNVNYIFAPPKNWWVFSTFFFSRFFIISWKKMRKWKNIIESCFRCARFSFFEHLQQVTLLSRWIPIHSRCPGRFILVAFSYFFPFFLNFFFLSHTISHFRRI